MLVIEFRCAGPAGGGSCASAIRREAVQTSEALNAAYKAILAEAARAGWRKDPYDREWRCPACLGDRAGPPPEVAGIPWPKWEEAMALYERGVMPSKWGGRDGLPTARQWNNALHRIPELARRARAAPAGKPRRKPHAAPVSEAMWARVVERFRAGEEKATICTGRDGWPTAKQWSGRLHNSPAFRAAVTARRKADADAVDWDGALKRFLAGDLLKDFLGTGAYPSRARWALRLARDEAFRRTVAEHYFWAWRGGEEEGNGDGRRIMRRQPCDEARYEKVLQGLREGLSLSEAAALCEAVTVSAFGKRVRENRNFAERYDEALLVSGRSRRPRAAGLPGRRFLERKNRDWIGAVETLRAGASVSSVIGRCMPIGDFPSRAQWYYRLCRDGEFKRLVERALRDGAPLRVEKYVSQPVPVAKLKRAIEMIRGGKSPKQAAAELGFHRSTLKNRCRRDPRLNRLYREALAAYREVAVFEPIGTGFRRKLLQNEIVAAVSAALPRYLEPDMRDEVMQNMVLAVLEGSLSIDDTVGSAGKYIGMYRRQYGRYGTVSLDAPLSGTDDLRLIDTLAAPEAAPDGI